MKYQRPKTKKRVLKNFMHNKIVVFSSGGSNQLMSSDCEIRSQFFNFNLIIEFLLTYLLEKITNSILFYNIGHVCW